MRNLIMTFVIGALFGTGLIVSGMTQPAMIIGFLDFSGQWDPTLAFVMLGALTVYAPAYRLIRKRNKPVYGAQFSVPGHAAIDGRLILGAALFGIGWGLSGYCPGPALASLASLSSNVIAVTGGMVAGIYFSRLFRAR